MSKARVLIAEDHKIVVEGLKKLLDSEFEIAGTVENGLDLVKAADTLHPDVIVADISMPGLSGIEALNQIRKTHKGMKVVFLTMHPDVAYAASAFKAGAAGYVLKHSAPDELVAAIRAALDGRTYVTPLIAGKLLESYEKGTPRQDDVTPGLSPRQCEVLKLLAEGHCVKEISAILGISMKTVEFHKYQMMDNLGIKTLAELIRYAVRHEIVSS